MKKTTTGRIPEQIPLLDGETIRQLVAPKQSARCIFVWQVTLVTHSVGVCSIRSEQVRLANLCNLKFMQQLSLACAAVRLTHICACYRCGHSAENA